MFTEMIYDEIEGFSFIFRGTVEKVLDDVVRCDDGAKIQFFEDMEYLISEFDEIYILEQRSSVKELEDLKKYCESVDDSDEMLEIINSKNIPLQHETV